MRTFAADPDTSEALKFRPNVAALIQVRGGFLACLRGDVGTWQTVQGGLEAEDLSPEEAILRELTEELGAPAENFKVLHRSRIWRRYRFPEAILRKEEKKGGFSGQDQLWFHVRCASLSACDLARSHGEFQALRVTELADLLAGYAEWKKPALQDFCAEIGLWTPEEPRRRKKGPAKKTATKKVAVKKTAAKKAPRAKR